jgi:outer membrane scaffolding protein for murein synthesis (MipA/OmpV family)
MHALNRGARAPHLRYRTATTLAITSLIACSSTAGAQERDSEGKQEVWSISLGAGALYRPDYEGSDDYEVRAIPVLNISYRDFIILRGPALKIDVFQLTGSELSRDLSFGPLVKYDLGREANDNPVLRDLAEVDGGLDAGFFAEYQLGPVSFGISAVQDTGDRHGGTLAQLQVDYGRPLGARLYAQFDASATWADDKYTRSYFGITPAEAQASGLRPFVASGGVKDVGTSVSLTYLLSRHWRVTGRLAYRSLLGDAADSPLVEDEGWKQQTNIALFASYEF